MFFEGYEENLKKFASQRKELEKMTMEIGRQIHENVFGFSEEWANLAKNTRSGFQEALQHCNSFLFPGMMMNEFFTEKTPSRPPEDLI